MRIGVVPWNKIRRSRNSGLEGLQEKLEIPLPASTQWGIVKETAEQLEPALEELIRQAAQGEVVYNDDTGMKVLALPAPEPERTGVFTSGIISTREGQRMALFFRGRWHAGENLSAVLARRAADLAPPIQMCDAPSRNLPKTLEVILGNCLAHGRRRFVKVAQNFRSNAGSCWKPWVRFIITTS